MLKNAYSDIKQLKIRIVGRMLHVQTGRDLGNFEVTVGPKGLKPLPVRCDRDCILEHIGDEAKPIANEVGIVLAKKLDQLSPTAPKSTNVVTAATPMPAPPASSAVSGSCTGLSSAYTIVLSGYESSDIGSIEAILVAFQGYQHHRPIKTQTLYSEYWYETCSDRARLERNLRQMAEQFPGQNRVALNGSRFEVEKIGTIPTR